MKSLRKTNIALAGIVITTVIWADTPWIFGLHDAGGEYLIEQPGKRGWIVISEAIGADPNLEVGSNYMPYYQRGHTVISRLNYGYYPNGCLPHDSQYWNFAQRCAKFVANSPGCRKWIIGNESNLPVEWPGGESGQPITPARYVQCFRLCYQAIKSVPGHENDEVIMEGIASWAPAFGGGVPDFMSYFISVANELAISGVDGIAIHAYTHGFDPPTVVFSNYKNGNYYWHFRIYRDYIAYLPASLRNKPLYITETDGIDGWFGNYKTPWVQYVYQEINDWNSNPSNPKIRTVCLYRWQAAGDAIYSIQSHPTVKADFSAACQNDYRWYLGPTHTPHKPCLLGDPNCDGYISSGDALLAFRIYLHQYEVTGNEICQTGCAADYDRSGDVTPVDALCIFKRYLGQRC